MAVDPTKHDPLRTGSEQLVSLDSHPTFSKLSYEELARCLGAARRRISSVEATIRDLRRDEEALRIRLRQVWVFLK